MSEENEEELGLEGEENPELEGEEDETSEENSEEAEEVKAKPNLSEMIASRRQIDQNISEEAKEKNK